MAEVGPPMTNVIKSIAHGSHIALKVIMKKETFLPLLSCEYVYAMPRIRAMNVSISVDQLFGKLTLREDTPT